MNTGRLRLRRGPHRAQWIEKMVRRIGGLKLAVRPSFLGVEGVPQDFDAPVSCQTSATDGPSLPLNALRSFEFSIISG